MEQHGAGWTPWSCSQAQSKLKQGAGPENTHIKQPVPASWKRWQVFLAEANPKEDCYHNTHNTMEPHFHHVHTSTTPVSRLTFARSYSTEFLNVGLPHDSFSPLIL